MTEDNKALVECDFPPGQPFSFYDETGEHDPCYVVLPGGASLPLNHHATPGVDIARAHFIVDACNAALASQGAAVTGEEANGNTKFVRLPVMLDRKRFDKLARMWGYTDEETADTYAAIIEIADTPPPAQPQAGVLAELAGDLRRRAQHSADRKSEGGSPETRARFSGQIIAWVSAAELVEAAMGRVG